MSGSVDDADLAGLAGGRVTPVGESVLRAISDASTPQGIVARVAMPEPVDVSDGADPVVVLAQVRDPGNAGTLVRSAVAAGAGAVVFSKGSVDPFGPKTVRASAGALFRVPIVRDADLLSTLGNLRESGVFLIGASARGSASYDEVDLTRRTAFVLGNEAWGLEPEITARLDEIVSIPMPGPVESLNVGIAGSILLFETVRQRRGLSS